MTLLKVDSIHTYIGQYHILQGISLEVPKGEVTVILGRNGAGKTTTLRSIMGLNPITKGEILFKGQPIHSLSTHEVARRGIGYVPENQGIFGDLTVEENLIVATSKNDDAAKARLETMLALFPDLKTYWKKKGGHLSGGQKQMLSIARAYMNDNELLLIDEPSKGLAPVIVEKLMESITQMKQHTTVILVEQNFMMASKIGDSFYIIDDGQTVHKGQMQELLENAELRKHYLGIA